MTAEWYGSSSGLVINGTTVEPIKTPSGILVTRAVETKDGWVGQIIVDKTIVWESEPIQDHPEVTRDAQREATRAANDRVVARMTEMFR